MRLVLRPLGRGAPPKAPIRVVLWPRQPHEIVIENAPRGRHSHRRPAPAERAAQAPSAPRSSTPHGSPPAASHPSRSSTRSRSPSRPRPVDPVELLMSAPASWKPGDPAPRIELLGLFQDGSPAARLRRVARASPPDRSTRTFHSSSTVTAPARSRSRSTISPRAPSRGFPTSTSRHDCWPKISSLPRQPAASASPAPRRTKMAQPSG